VTRSCPGGRVWWSPRRRVTRPVRGSEAASRAAPRPLPPVRPDRPDFCVVRFTWCLHLYTLPEVEETYEFNDDSYAALAAAGIAWQDVIYALHDSRPKSAGTSGRC
jgi:hypothetical protein